MIRKRQSGKREISPMMNWTCKSQSMTQTFAISMNILFVWAPVLEMWETMTPVAREDLYPQLKFQKIKNSSSSSVKSSLPSLNQSTLSMFPLRKAILCHLTVVWISELSGNLWETVAQCGHSPASWAWTARNTWCLPAVTDMCASLRVSVRCKKLLKSLTATSSRKSTLSSSLLKASESSIN